MSCQASTACGLKLSAEGARPKVSWPSCIYAPTLSLRLGQLANSIAYNIQLYIDLVAEKTLG